VAELTLADSDHGNYTVKDARTVARLTSADSDHTTTQ